jgi:hypothetical protein
MVITRLIAAATAFLTFISMATAESTASAAKA